jgi:uncharacterized protein YbjQ (UPF0145 family)
MFMLLGGNEKKTKKEVSQAQSVRDAKELFNMGRFPVVTTQQIENRPIAKVLGLVCCRGFDSEEAFFGMAAMAVNKGAQGIIGYNENVAFHPDGSKYFSCFGTAVMFEREGRNDLLSDTNRIKNALSRIPTADPTKTNSLNTKTYNKAVDDLGGDQDTVSLSSYGKNLQNAENGGVKKEDIDLTEKKQVFNSAQIAAQLMQEEEEEEIKASAYKLSQPAEEDDPVLQRILASQKRQAVSNMQ